MVKAALEWPLVAFRPKAVFLPGITKVNHRGQNKTTILAIKCLLPPKMLHFSHVLPPQTDREMFCRAGQAGTKVSLEITRGWWHF